MSSKILLRSVASSVLLWSALPLASAQTLISEDTEGPLATSTAIDGVSPDDITIESGATVTGTGDIVTLDSNNSIINDGTITSGEVEAVAANVVATGILVTGGNSGNVTNTGTISLLDSIILEDTDGDGLADGDIADGASRVGILISGASPFVGNVEVEPTGSINVEGANSSSIRLDTNTDITGDIINSGVLTALGTDVTGFDIEGAVLGAVTNNGSIQTQGEGARAIHIEGNVDGRFVDGRFTNTGAIANTGILSDTNPLQSGAAIEINNTITGGVFLGSTFEDVETTDTLIDEDTNEIINDADGNPETITVITPTVVQTSSIIQNGAAPAILIEGQDTTITLGQVGLATDNRTASDETFEFGFVNQGTITANGFLDDSPATGVEIANANISGGIFNSGEIEVTTVRSGDDGIADVGGFDGHARGIFLRDNVTTDRIENDGSIVVTSSEGIDNPEDPRLVQATAIEISATSTLTDTDNPRLLNNGIIQAIATGRNAQATAIIDNTDTLTTITNQSSIQAVAQTSNVSLDDGIDPTLSATAIDLSASTNDITITQQTSPAAGGFTVTPNIIGDILLGSGDDTLTSTAGIIASDIDFAGGSDTLTLSDTDFAGTIANTGTLDITVVNGGSLTTEAGASAIDSIFAVNATDITFANTGEDPTSTFSTSLDGNTGNAGTIVATNNITFQDGSIIEVELDSLADDGATFDIAEAGGTLRIDGDLADFDASAISPFLYETSFALDPNDPNTLVVTLDLRDPGAPVAEGGLGLDARQTGVFLSAFDAIRSNAELDAAISSIQEGDGDAFSTAFNQLLPQTSAAPLFFIQSGVDGAFGAVGSHLENARRSQDRTGGAWLQQFTFFADREIDQQSEQFRGFGFGFTGGLDTAWGPFHAIGANIGFTSTEIEDVIGFDQPLDVVTYQGGVYAGSEWNNLSLDLFAGAGLSDIKDNRFVTIGDFTGISASDRNATHFNGSARLGYTAKLGDSWWVRPVATLDYLRLEEDAFEEDGDQGLALTVAARDSERAGITGLLNVGTTIQGRRTWIKPAIRAGYRTDFIADPVLTQFQFLDTSLGGGATLNGNEFIEVESGGVADDAFILGFTVAAGSRWSSFSFDFDSDIRDGFIRHTGRVVVRLLF